MGVGFYDVGLLEHLPFHTLLFLIIIIPAFGHIGLM